MSVVPEGFIPFPLNPVGICHGGMPMAVADMAVGFSALKASGRKVFPPSINNNFDFLAPGKLGDWLESRIPFVKVTGSLAFANGIIHCDDNPVLRFNGICKMPKDTDKRFAGNKIFDNILKTINGG